MKTVGESNIKVVVPTCNGGALWLESLNRIVEQFGKQNVVVIDSSSSDGTTESVVDTGVEFHCIERSEFNHGGTRNLGLELIGNAEYLLFLTQDALIAEGFSVDVLLKHFDDESVGAVCCRQLPHDDANPLATHARDFNYPDTSRVNTRETISDYGIKSVFMSNSCAAYRVSALKSVGGFPSKTILAEDMYVAAKMILSDMKTVYAADVCVHHSHNYSPLEEFKRYFDTGVFHSDEKWIFSEFGGASGEGGRFVRSELKYLASSGNVLWIPRAVVTTALKLLGMELGKRYRSLSVSWRRRLSMHSRYWGS